MSFSLHYTGGSDGKEFACSAGDLGSIPGSRKSPGEGNDNPLQCSCLENSMHRGACRARVHGIAELDLTEWLTHTHTHTHILHLEEDFKSWKISQRENMKNNTTSI